MRTKEEQLNEALELLFKRDAEILKLKTRLDILEGRLAYHQRIDAEIRNHEPEKQLKACGCVNCKGYELDTSIEYY